MSNEKAAMTILTVGLIKKIKLYKMSYFPERLIHIKNEIEVDFDLSNYATKSDLKNAIDADTLEFCKKMIWLA